MKVLLINSMSGVGSTGKIVDGIANVLLERGHTPVIAYGYGNASHPVARRFGSDREQFIHKSLSHAFDMQGLGSRKATHELIRFIKEFQPDIVNIHTIHGNYLNYPALFELLKGFNGKIVWTLHDCWTFTGHCPHFTFEGCYKWQTGCHDCKQLWMYPKSHFWDGSRRNYRLKKKHFLSVKDKLTIVAVSDWLAGLAKQSFFKDVNITTIHNGINLDAFSPVPQEAVSDVLDKYNIPRKKIVLAVASPWSKRKGWDDLLHLRTELTDDYEIVIVGISEAQKAILPEGISGVLRTENVQDLAALYTAADVLVNPTYEDCYPTVNLESIACGTPVVTYRTGGSPEAITPLTGSVVDQGDVKAMANAICNRNYASADCIEHAVSNFSARKAFGEYVTLFESIV